MANQEEEEKRGFEAINKLKSTDPPLFLAPNSDLSITSRMASQFLFKSLKQYSLKSPFDHLLIDGFDAEQIWQQIDLQSQPLIGVLKREIKMFEKNPSRVSILFEGFDGDDGVLRGEIKGNGEVGFDGDSEEFEGFSGDDEERENGEVEEDDEDESESEGEEEEEEEEGEEEEIEDDGDGVPEVEDDFLKIKDLEKYLVKEEEKEYGLENKKRKKGKKEKRKGGTNDDDDEEEDEDEFEEEDGDEFLMFGGDAGEEDETEDNIRYEDFFLPNKKMPKRKQKQVDKLDDLGEDGDVDGSEDLMMEDEDDDTHDLEMEDGDDKQEEGNLSTFEKQRQKIKAQIEQMEAENLAPKHWTMQGEVSASKRPVDSALEVDGDVVHTRIPPPVITEEVTASLEDIIKKRILEGHFDDVQKAPKLPPSTFKETKELDDNKSKKGLAEIYEEDYAKQTGLVSAPSSFSDELHKEASDLFKKLCLKLDALSHFHFAPKPVVEDMSIQNNVPALAMEEIAPIAKSDADMLAPEEVFSGKANIKEENELTKDDRKRRRAKKKRKFKAINSKRAASKAVEKPAPLHTEDKEQ